MTTFTVNGEAKAGKADAILEILKTFDERFEDPRQTLMTCLRVLHYRDIETDAEEILRDVLPEFLKDNVGDLEDEISERINEVADQSVTYYWQAYAALAGTEAQPDDDLEVYLSGKDDCNSVVTTLAFLAVEADLREAIDGKLDQDSIRALEDYRDADDDEERTDAAFTMSEEIRKLSGIVVEEDEDEGYGQDDDDQDDDDQDDDDQDDDDQDDDDQDDDQGVKS